MSESFHKFPLLPTELRLLVWKMAAQEPRTVVFLKSSPTASHLFHGYRVPNPAPAILHACHESRFIGTKTYEKAFGWNDSYYLWFNFDQDIVQVDCFDIRETFPEFANIKHLRGEYFWRRENPVGDLVSIHEKMSSRLESFDLVHQTGHDHMYHSLRKCLGLAPDERPARFRCRWKYVGR